MMHTLNTPLDTPLGGTPLDIPLDGTPLDKPLDTPLDTSLDGAPGLTLITSSLPIGQTLNTSRFCLI